MIAPMASPKALAVVRTVVPMARVERVAARKEDVDILVAVVVQAVSAAVLATAVALVTTSVGTAAHP